MIITVAIVIPAGVLLIIGLGLICWCRHRSLNKPESQLTATNLSKVPSASPPKFDESAKRISLGSSSASSMTMDEEEEEKPYVTSSIARIQLLHVDQQKPRAR